MIHLAISAVMAGIAAGLVFFVWYPHPFEVLAGGINLFLLITSVDVVMGPLLTLTVFNPRKPRTTLRRDLLVIGMFQAAALAYGLHTIYVARPAVLALEGNHFRVVTVVDVAEEELGKAPPGLRKLPIWGPKIVRTREPTAAEHDEAMLKALAGQDLGSRPSYWHDWDQLGRAQAKAAARPLSELMAHHPAQAAEIERILDRTGVPRDRLKYLPVLSRFGEGVMLVDSATGELSGYVPYDAP